MKIEITDRDYWLERVNNGLTIIENVRKRQDEKFVKRWRTRNGFMKFFGFKDRPDTAFPELETCDSYYNNYPSYSYSYEKHLLSRLKLGLETEKSSTIFFSDEEITIIDNTLKIK